MVDRDEEVYMFEEEEENQISRKKSVNRYLLMLPYLTFSIIFAYFFYKYAFKYPDNTACWANGSDNFATAFQESDSQENMAKTFAEWFLVGFILSLCGIA